MSMRYLSVTRAGFKVALVYRFNFMITIFTTPISLLVYYFLWKSIFAFSSAEIIRGFTFQQMISYYALNMLIGFIIWTYADEDLEERVVSGSLTPVLLRPLNYFWENFSEHMGVNVISILMNIVPISLIAIIFFGLRLPTLLNGILFIILIAVAILLNFTLAYLVGLTSFWFKEISGIRRVRRVIISFLAGSFIPLTFFPEWVSKLSNFLPFQYMRYVPITIYLGNHTTAESLWLIFGAFAWLVALYFISKLAWRSAYNKFAGSGT
ncbi:ABC-2 family transporter protein [Candidatus Woesearchaeota archaeon]|nr:ABC-2 family transporter protein [Candidatus Woesearchaeota archaeon]